MRIILALMVVTICSGVWPDRAIAQPLGVSGLTTMCQAEEGKTNSAGDPTPCRSFITGVGMMMTLMSKDPKKRPFCKPEFVSSEEVRDTVLLYIRAHPKLNNMPARNAVAQALTQSYPCTR